MRSLHPYGQIASFPGDMPGFAGREIWAGRHILVHDWGHNPVKYQARGRGWKKNTETGRKEGWVKMSRSDISQQLSTPDIWSSPPPPLWGLHPVATAGHFLGDWRILRLENGVRRRMAVLIVAENDERVRAINWYRQKEIVLTRIYKFWVWISPTFCPCLLPSISSPKLQSLSVFRSSQWPFVLLWWLSTLTSYNVDFPFFGQLFPSVSLSFQSSFFIFSLIKVDKSKNTESDTDNAPSHSKTQPLNNIMNTKLNTNADHMYGTQTHSHTRNYEDTRLFSLLYVIPTGRVLPPQCSRNK